MALVHVPRSNKETDFHKRLDIALQGEPWVSSADNMSIDLSEDDKLLIMQLVVRKMFAVEDDPPTETPSRHNCKQLPSDKSPDAEHNRLLQIVQSLDPNFLDNDNFELTKDMRERIIMDLADDFFKNGHIPTVEDEENEGEKDVALPAEDEKVLKSVIESTIKVPQSCDGDSIDETEENTSFEKVQVESEKDNAIKNIVTLLAGKTQMNEEYIDNIHDLPTRLNSRTNLMEDEVIVIDDDDDNLPISSTVNPTNEITGLQDLPCSSSEQNNKVTCSLNNEKNIVKDNGKYKEPRENKIEAMQSSRTSVIDSNNDNFMVKRTPEPSVVQENDIDRLLVLLKKAKDFLCAANQVPIEEETGLSTDNLAETNRPETRVEENLKKKEHKKKHVSRKDQCKRASNSREDNKTDVYPCPRSPRVTSTTAPSSEDEDDIEQQIIALKKEIYNLRKGDKLNRSERKSNSRERDEHRNSSRQVIQKDREEDRERRDHHVENNERLSSVGTVTKTVKHEKRKAVEEWSNISWKLTKRHCKPDTKVAPMNDKESPFYIDKSKVPVRIYREGLTEKRWNPTQVLYEICSQCEWPSPEFNQLSYTAEGGFLFNVTVKDSMFIPGIRGWTKKEAKHHASSHFLNFIGFEFNYSDLKANSWKSSLSITQGIRETELIRRDRIDSSKDIADLHRSHQSRSKEVVRNQLEYKRDGSNTSRSSKRLKVSRWSSVEKREQHDVTYQSCDAKRENYKKMKGEDHVRHNTERIRRSHSGSLNRDRSSSADRCFQCEKCCPMSHSRSNRRPDCTKVVSKRHVSSPHRSHRESPIHRGEEIRRSHSPCCPTRHRSSSKTSSVGGRSHKSRYESHKQQQKSSCCSHVHSQHSCT